MKMIRLLTGLLLFLLIAHSASAANYYVRDGATGAQTGKNWTDAYPELPARLVRGATYYVAAGIYPGYVFRETESGRLVTTIRKATVADHGINRGWQDSYAEGQAVFSGMIEFTSGYWTFDGVTGGGPENGWSRNFGFKVTETSGANAVLRISYTGRARDVTVRHVELQGMGGPTDQGGYFSNDGIAIYNEAANTIISHAWLHDIGRCPVFIISTTGDTIFEYLYVSAFFGSGSAHSALMSAGQGFMGDVTWRYSLITASESTGGLGWNNFDSPNAHLYVYGNVFYQQAGASWTHGNGIIFGWYTPVKNRFSNVWVYNNTFVNVDYMPLSNIPTVYSGNRAYNNIFYNTASPDFSRFSDHDYNLFINSGDKHSEPNGISAARGNPFADLANLNFALTSATAGGLMLSSPPGIAIDGLGHARGGDGSWDRGAVEFGGAAVKVANP